MKLETGEKKFVKSITKGKLGFIIGIIVGILLYSFFGEIVIKYISDIYSDVQFGENENLVQINGCYIRGSVAQKVKLER